MAPDSRLWRLRQKKEADVSALEAEKARLETKRMDLKEQREALKEKGAKHEDGIMKENAVWQVRHK